VRQGVADLITLAHALPGINLTGSVNAGSIHFLGHSLGGIVGGTFMGVIPSAVVGTATLANPGGEVAQLLRDSPTFAPQINAGLQASGLQPGTTLYEQFFRDAQTVVDAGDPINFIALASSNHPIHLLQVVGGANPPAPAACAASPTPAGCPDQVVPNSATQRLITASSYGADALTRIAAPAAPGPVVNAGGFRAYVNFTSGDHGSIIDDVVPAVTAEMQGEAITFAGGSLPPIPALGFPGFPATPAGTTILILNPTVIEP
jgi:hypothetical protein